MSSIKIAIGRNLNNTIAADEMPEWIWQDFINEVTDATFRCLPTKIVMNATCSSFVGWGSWEGVKEQNCILTFNSPRKIKNRHLKALKEELAELAETYCQDAIAINGELVYSSTYASI